jgi:hypothetical protein
VFSSSNYFSSTEDFSTAFVENDLQEDAKSDSFLGYIATIGLLTIVLVFGLVLLGKQIKFNKRGMKTRKQISSLLPVKGDGSPKAKAQENDSDDYSDYSYSESGAVAEKGRKEGPPPPPKKPEKVGVKPTVKKPVRPSAVRKSGLKKPKRDLSEDELWLSIPAWPASRPWPEIYADELAEEL